MKKWLLVVLLVGLHTYSLNHFQVWFAAIYLLAIACLTVFFLKQSVGVEKQLVQEFSDLGEIRLYQPPGNLAPLLVARYVFGQDVVRLAPDGYRTADGLSFEGLIQASLLDLLDRGCLILENDQGKSIFYRQSASQLAPFEEELLQLVFNGADRISAEAIFAHQGLTVTSGTAIDQAMRSKFEHNNNLILRRMRIRDLVDKQIEADGLPALYRPLTAEEELLIDGLTRRFIILFFLLIYLGIYVVLHLSPWFFVLVVLGEFLIWRAYFGGKAGLVVHPDGAKLPNREGYLEQQRWLAFKRTLDELDLFEHKELTDHLLWNRYLVYGVLFGQAEAIQQGMKLAYPDVNLSPEERRLLVEKSLLDKINI